MPYCPKCKTNQQVGVSFRVSGDIEESWDIDSYPIVESESAEPEDMAWCFGCEHEAPLKDFKIP